jgi:hypothetical protein
MTSYASRGPAETVALLSIIAWDVRVGALTYIAYILASRIYADWQAYEAQRP